MRVLSGLLVEIKIGRNKMGFCDPFEHSLSGILTARYSSRHCLWKYFYKEDDKWKQISEKAWDQFDDFKGLIWIPWLSVISKKRMQNIYRQQRAIKMGSWFNG